MALAAEDSDLLLPVLRALSMRGPMWALAIHTAQVNRLALEMAFLSAHVIRLRPRALSRSVPEPPAIEARHRRASLFERRHTMIPPPPNVTLSDLSSFSASSFVATLITTDACCPLGLCDYTQVHYKCSHLRYTVRAWCTKYQETHKRCPANVVAM